MLPVGRRSIPDRLSASSVARQRDCNIGGKHVYGHPCEHFGGFGSNSARTGSLSNGAKMEALVAETKLRRSGGGASNERRIAGDPVRIAVSVAGGAQVASMESAVARDRRLLTIGDQDAERLGGARCALNPRMKRFAEILEADGCASVPFLQGIRGPLGGFSRVAICAGIRCAELDR